MSGRPIMEQLLDDGAIVGYGISSEAVVTESPSMLSWWCVMADADGFDKVEAAFDAYVHGPGVLVHSHRRLQDRN